MLRSKIKKLVRVLRGDVAAAHTSISETDVPFDNSYKWLWESFEKVMKDPVAAKRPHYVWGILQGAALGKVLGYERVSVIEVGVAGGAGLLAMERAADICEGLIGIKIEVYGFDTGSGMPKPEDYRDMPYKWSEGYYPCNLEELKKRLRRSDIKMGLLKNTVPAFAAQDHAPVAFVGFDVCMYSATKDALGLLLDSSRALLPRMPCAFRSAIGKDVSDFTGELLAISEFNGENPMRKITPIRGLEYFVPERFRWWWIDMMYSLHIFDHPRYGSPDAYQLSSVIDLDDNEEFHAVNASY